MLVPTLNAIECLHGIIGTLIPSFRIVKLERAIINFSAITEYI